MLRQFTILFGIILGIGGGSYINAQDQIYSQFYAAPLQVNPAFAGNTYAPFISINYRNQWSSIPQAYRSYTLSYDQFFEDLNSGFGLMVSSDDAGLGLWKTNRITGTFAYRVQVNRDFSMKLGVEAGAIQTRIAWDKFIFPDQIDQIDGPINSSGIPFDSGEVAPDNLNRTVLDISAGILAYGPKFYGGLSLKHINTPNDNYLDINTNLNAGWPMRMTVHGGMQITLQEGNKRNSKTFISPNVLYIQQRDFAQLNVGAYASIGPVFAGLWYRQAFTNSDAAIVLVGVQRGVFKFGYSYDYTVSSLENTQSGGSHEVSISLNFETGRRVDYNDCFDLFR